VFFRLVSTAIVLFWITMTALLVRSEFWPDRSQFRAMPVEHVAKLLWLHEQESHLRIWSEGFPVGHLSLKPVLRDDGVRLLKYSGNLQLRIPGIDRQRVSWEGFAEFDSSWNLRSLAFDVGIREPSPVRAELVVKPVERTAYYRRTNAGVQLESGTYSLDEAGLKKVLTQLDLDPALYDAFRSKSTKSAPIVAAQQSSLKIHRERVDTYLVDVRQGGQTLFEAHVSQLGQLLRVKSMIGFTLAPDDIVP
jgi:hypothetical protein